MAKEKSHVIKKNMNPKQIVRKIKDKKDKINKKTVVQYIKNTSQKVYRNKGTRKASYSVGGPKATSLFVQKHTSSCANISRSPEVKYYGKGRPYLSTF